MPGLPEVRRFGVSASQPGGKEDNQGRDGSGKTEGMIPWETEDGSSFYDSFMTLSFVTYKLHTMIDERMNRFECQCHDYPEVKPEMLRMQEIHPVATRETMGRIHLWPL
jgi:hypothetical protein